MPGTHFCETLPYTAKVAHQLSVIRSMTTEIDAHSTSGAFMLKLGGGIGYDLNEKISLVGQPALNIYLKSGSMTELSLMVGASEY